MPTFDTGGDTVVRIGSFGNRTKDATVAEQEERLADRNDDGVVDATEAEAARRRTEERLANRERLMERARAAEAADADRTTADRTMTIDRDRDGVDDRAERYGPPAVVEPPAERPVEPPTAPVVREPRVRAHTSMLAMLALMVGLTAVYCALSGRLAPIAVVLGVVGLLFSFGGLLLTGRRRVTGSTMAVLALILSVGGGVLGILAMNHTAHWLDSDVDQIARLRDWLDAQLPFLRSW
jgi:hypothetical protein